MSVTVKPVSTRRELRIFADYPNKLYSGNPYFVPKIYKDELDTFNPRKNAAYEFSEAELFLAWKDGKVVGRVAAIINNLANKKCLRGASRRGRAVREKARHDPPRRAAGIHRFRP